MCRKCRASFLHIHTYTYSLSVDISYTFICVHYIPSQWILYTHIHIFPLSGHYMCVCVYRKCKWHSTEREYVYVCICVYIYIYIYTQVYSYTYASTQIYVNSKMCMCRQWRARDMSLRRTNVCVCVCVYIHISISTPKYIHIFIGRLIDMHKHTKYVCVGHGGQVAFHWEGNDEGETKDVTYQQLQVCVCIHMSGWVCADVYMYCTCIFTHAHTHTHTLGG